MDETPRQIDARGLMCPLPVLKARKILDGMAPGSILEITADDPMAAVDMPHYCDQAGHVLVEVRKPGPVFVIRRG